MYRVEHDYPTHNLGEASSLPDVTCYYQCVLTYPVPMPTDRAHLRLQVKHPTSLSGLALQHNGRPRTFTQRGTKHARVSLPPPKLQWPASLRYVFLQNAAATGASEDTKPLAHDGSAVGRRGQYVCIRGRGRLT